MSYSVSNWSGSVQFKPKKILYPRDEGDLREMIINSAADGHQIRVVGTGHSFMPLIETRDVLISLDQMQGISHFDEASGDATLLAGTKLWKMNELLFEKNRCLENLGDINRQSIAGTISTGTHGTGKRFGTIATQVKELTLITANGSPHRCSETENPELFKAAQVSLGALGVISKVKLRTLPAYKLHFVQKKVHLDDLLRNLDQTAEKHRHFEFFGFPNSKWVAAKYVDETQAPLSTNKLSTMIDAILMENILFKILSEISRWIPGMTKPIAQLCASATSGASRVNWAHEVFSTPRWVKFQEMEYNVPATAMKDVLTELMQMIERKNIRVHFPIECRYVKGDDIWMSPAYGRDSAYLAIHQYKGMDYEDYFKAAERIFLNHGGRPHWGKRHFLSAKELKPLYPKWDEFQRTREHLDPKGMFLSPALRRLFIA
jgi:FAD-linked oxidoreductase